MIPKYWFPKGIAIKAVSFFFATVLIGHIRILFSNRKDAENISALGIRYEVMYVTL
jgi:hypothetical protein